MKDERKIENKVIAPEENKAPVAKKVRVQINPKRNVTGVGQAGETKRIDSDLAKSLRSQGLVTILDELDN